MSDRDRFGRCAGRLAGKVRRTCRRWALLGPGSRVALGISGGTDSLAMMMLLMAVSQTLREPLDMVGLHVALDARGTTSGVGQEVRDCCAEHGVTVHDVAPRMEREEEPPLDCHRCARIRRRTLLEEADERGYRHLAIGHHADDVVETWLLSLFYTGNAETIPPLRSYFDGAVILVRPLYELRRVELLRLVRLSGVQVESGECEQEGDSRRARVREVLSALGRDQRLVRRQLYWNAVRYLADAEA